MSNSTTLTFLIGLAFAAPLTCTRAFAAADYTPSLFVCKNDKPAMHGFRTFQQELKEAIAKKDSNFIKAHTSDTIKSSFDDEPQTKARFLTSWGFDHEPEKSKFWDAMSAMLELDGIPDAYNPKIIQFPCLAGDLPIDNWSRKQHQEIGAADYAVVIVKDAVIYGEKDNVLRPLHFMETVMLAPYSGAGAVPYKEGYQAYKTYDGLTGYVKPKIVRAPLDLRATFKLENDKWMLATFVSGD